MSMKSSAMLRIALLVILVPLTAVSALSQEVEFDERLVAMAESRAEFEAAEAIDVEESPVNRLTMTDAFLNEYPESQLKHQIHMARLRTYVDLNNNQAILTSAAAYVEAETAFFDSKVSAIDDTSDVDGYPQFEIDHYNNLTFAYQSMMNASAALGRPDDAAMYAELALQAAEDTWNSRSRMLQAGTPEYQEGEQRYRQAQLFFLQTAMTTYQNSNNAARTVEYAERALRLDPQNLATLLTISTVMAERPPDNESQRQAHFESAQEYAEQALEVLERFLDAAGAQISEQQRTGLLSGAHLTLGTIFLNREEWDDAQDSLEESLEYAPRDAVAYLRLGMAYARDEEAEDAMEALARSVYLNGPAQARELLEQIYEIRNESLTGLDAFIESQGAEIN